MNAPPGRAAEPRDRSRSSLATALATVLQACGGMRALLATVLLAGCGAELGEPPSQGGGGSGGLDRGSCNVDVVLGIDNSGSTDKEQDALRGALPDFADELRDLGDFRVALVDGCATPARFHTRGQSGACNFAGGHPWIESSSSHVHDELRCVAEIDSSGEQCTGNNDDEEPLTTATTALEAAWAGASQPNAGFLRADGLLVVIALTDSGDALFTIYSPILVHLPGTPEGLTPQRSKTVA